MENGGEGETGGGTGYIVCRVIEMDGKEWELVRVDLMAAFQAYHLICV
jgi:hypothetical protein